jgi:hypothetical protein
MTDQTVLIKVSSKDMVISRSNSNSDFYVSLNNTSRTQNIKGVMVKSVNFTNTIQNVPSHKNSFIFTAGGVEHEISITPDYYTLEELIIEVENSVNSIIAPETCVINENLNGTITLTMSVAISFISNDTAQRNPLAEILGFSYFDDNTTPALTQTSSGLPQLVGTTRIYIESDALANSNMINPRTDSADNVLVSVPIDTNYGGQEQYTINETTTNTILYERLTNVGNIDIKVKDEDGYIIDFYNQHITIILMLIV